VPAPFAIVNLHVEANGVAVTVTEAVMSDPLPSLAVFAV
jgi:hypothetical protein